MKPVDGRQLRAARAILGWTSEEAALAARLHRNSVTRAEAMKALPIHSHAADRLGDAYEAAGVVFERGETGPTISFSAPQYRMRRRDLRRQAA